jgi:hypothetical protein
MFLDDNGTSTDTSDPWGNLSGSGTSTDTSDPWGNLSGSGNSDPSWDSEVTGGDNTSTDVGTDTGTSGYTGGGSEESVFDPTSIYEITNTATTPGSAGYGWKYYSDGTSISPDGKYYHQGEMVYDVNNPEQGMLSRLLGKDVAKALKSKFVNPDGSPNLAGIGAIGMTLYGLANKDKQGGYNKPVPKMDMVREQVQYNDPNRRPGEGGRQYFTDPRFATQGNAESIAAAKAASAEQGQGILAAYQPRPAQAPNPYAGKMNLGFSRPGGPAASAAQTSATEPAQQAPERGLPGALKSAYLIAPVTGSDLASPVVNTPPVSNVAAEGYKEAANRNAFESRMADPEYRRLSEAANAARGDRMTMEITPEEQALSRYSGVSKSYPQQEKTMAGLEAAAKAGMGLAEGGIADAGRYLQGKTDGMADEIPSSIDGEQPAALSHGEFVIPADVVSHLGNGNSDAGAQKLYEMMARIRKARTGNSEQGKEINAEEFTMGGIAGYAGGGTVKGFNGVNGSDVNATGGNGATGATGGGGVPNDISRTSTLSPWVGDYVTNALGQGAALAAAPYQAYQGPLTAGASNLQQQAFAGASEMAMAGYNPAQFTGGFNAQTAQQYMNPYLQASLDPQLKELNRQSQIARLEDSGRLTKAGAYGGSRQAIMESEGRRNLLDKQQDVLATGYKTAYDAGLGQFNKERDADESSRQFGANFGLKSIDQLSGLGAVERGITSEGLAADKAQFEEQRDFAYGMPKYQLGLLSGLPIGANTTSVDQDALSKLQSQISGLGANYTLLDNALKDLRVTN